MSQTATVSYNGVGFPGLLAVVFITLKLLGIIGWSWWWVLAPLWAGLAVFGVFVVVALVIAIIVGIVNAIL